MLIDVNAYIGHWPYRRLEGNTLSDLIERMNRFGVDQSIVSNIHGIFYKFPDFANEELAEAIRSDDTYSERIIPFAVINPVVPWWEQALDQCKESYGMKGIRIYPLYHHYELTDSRCVQMVEAARERGMPVAIPQRMIDPRQRSWLDVGRTLGMNAIAELVRWVPDASYMMLDTRGTASGTAREILREADILFDSTRATGVPIQGLSGTSFQYLSETFGYDKIAFGTGTPFIDYCSPFIRASVYEEADENSLQKIFSGNVKRMLAS